MTSYLRTRYNGNTATEHLPGFPFDKVERQYFWGGGNPEYKAK